MDLHQYKILILDFGSQYTRLIARRIREIGIFCEIFPYDVSDNFIKNYGAQGIILSGGPDNSTNSSSAYAPNAVFELGIPVLGVCYGMHTMTMQLGGNTINSSKAEFGYAKIRAHNHSPLLNNIADETTSKGYGMLDVWMSHGIEVSTMPKDFVKIASSDNCEIAGMANFDKHLYGIQFHPEVTHTKQGKAILERFCLDICGCEAHWNSENIIKDLIDNIRLEVGDEEEVLLALSGGVDSSVVAALVHKAIGDRLTCVFVDNGLLRMNEGDEVMKQYNELLGFNVIRIDAQERFYNALRAESNPEVKRKIIGHTFIEIFEEEARKLNQIKFLAQGTIYPDIIESAGNTKSKAKVIKSHHNVGGLPDELSFKLIEPLRELFKDEVRIIGVKLGIPKHILYRHPFPGPGLGVRILGEVKAEYADMLRTADHIFISELRNHNLYDEVSQAFVVFLPVKSVGVTGDERRYEYVVALRAVQTIDFMTAHWAHLPYEFLDIVSNRIINEIPTISRVVYDISGKPPATIEWE